MTPCTPYRPHPDVESRHAIERIMTEPGEILGVIPARKGSKRLPRKNVRQLGGKTLVEWAVESARASRLVDRFVVSTDDVTIMGAPLLLRPPELATDDAPMLGVLQHALQAIERQEKVLVTIVVCLQPITPFRSGALIDAVLTNMGAADSSLTVCNGYPTGEVYASRRDLLLSGRMLGPTCVDYLCPYPAINIDTEYDLVRAERWMSSHRSVLWPVR